MIRNVIADAIALGLAVVLAPVIIVKMAVGIAIIWFERWDEA